MNFLLPCYFEKTWLLWLVCLKYYYFCVNINFCLESFGSEYSYHNQEDLHWNYAKVSLRIKNSFFITYLLEDEQELSLGMPDTSPTYLQFFIVPCYYIIYFGCLMGFNMLFYIIFGTNLLTGGPAQIAVFLPISVFRRKGISNGVQMEWYLRERDFLTEHDLGDLDPTSRNKGGGHEVGGAPTP